MGQNKPKITNLLLFLLIVTQGLGQSLKAKLIDYRTNIAIADALILDENTGNITYSDQDGNFIIQLEKNQAIINLVIKHRLYSDYTAEVKSDKFEQSHVFYLIQNDNVNIDLSALQVETNDDVSPDESEVYSILGSSKDILQQTIAFEFSIMRYRNRGISNRFDQFGINGFLLNDITNSQVPYYLISGQNLLSRYSETAFSFPEQNEDFGSAGNNQWVEIRLDNFRRGLTCNYSTSNRSYRNRIGVHYVNSNLKKDFYYMVGANRRWAQEGGNPGTFYDAYGIYGGIQKNIRQNISMQALTFFTPVVRSRSAPVVNEVVELTGNTLYNPYWGYQVNQKRNSRMVNTRVPVILLTLENRINSKVKDAYGIMFGKGRKSRSNIDWTNIRDPRPDYYQYLPSYEEDLNAKEEKILEWQRNSSISQMNWDYFYQTNYNSYETIYNINGGNDSIYGRRSQYTLLDNHNDPTELEVYLRRRIQFSHKKSLVLNLRFENVNVHYYNRMLDLLGGDYYLDHENFIEGDQNSNSQVVNHVIYKGDKFGQDYRINSTRVSFYQQWSQRFRRFDWIIGLEEGLNWNSLKRNYQNKIFSNQNANDKFFKNLQWGVKSNLTYKINGRNYLIWNFGVNYLNPNTEQIYINPAWRADKLPVEDQTKVFSGILTYKYQSPNFKIHFAAYSSWFLDQILTRRFYLDAGSEEDPDSELLDGGFINGFYTNLDQQHLGLELAIQYTITPKLELSLVGQKGEYIYINRPNYYIYDQYSSSSDIKLIYLKNFYVAGTPQSAISAQIKYEIFNHATLRLSANYFSANFVEINPLRRISEAVAGVERNSTEFQAIVDQEKLNNAFVVNASIYKSWKVQNHFLSLSLNVNNILNNRNLISGGFEQSRFDYSEKIVSKFPNKYFHLQGINYFLSLNYSLN